jgi:HNH endonuclease
MTPHPHLDTIEDKLNHVSKAVLDLLRKNPKGLDIDQIKAKISVGADQMHLDKRLRDLRKFFKVPRKKVEGRWVYVYEGPNPNLGKTTRITTTQRARILNLAKGRCQNCGASIDKDGIRLEVDHRIPQEWGGSDDDENLWAICVPCNHGKKNFFESFNPQEMAELVAIKSVHERIAKFLRMHKGQWVDSPSIEDVANLRDRQDDWQKRLRELRYPVIGMEIEVTRYKTVQGSHRSRYRLVKWVDLPPDHQKLIKDWDRPEKRAVLKKRLGIA